ncbi:MAG: 2OG-Fe(II) oxygenase [Proteobacteria bacterium]|nr:2OG-Fe(II) oxygenase [Pseudomonadota bacterium]
MFSADQLVEKYGERLHSGGTIMMPFGDNFLTEEEFAELESLAENLPKEHIELGDAGEPNKLEVGRFLTDVEGIEYVNRPASDRAVEILAKPALMDFYCKILDHDQLFIRRMQYNIMREGSFVGFHLDIDSNPDYTVAVVIQLGQEFTGGEYAVFGGDMPPRVLEPTHRSIIISKCEFPHEVRVVKSGARKSLVFFLSPNDGPNLRQEGQSQYERGEVPDLGQVT